MPAVDAAAPGRSKRPGRRSVSASTRGASQIRTAPTGTLIHSPHRHEIQSVSMPPRIRPTLPPPPATAPYAASARMRSGPSRKFVVRSASEDGAAIAAPTLWSARAPSSHACVCASPPTKDATVNSAMPAMNVRRRPRMSPMRAPSSSRPPNVSAYALCTHDSAAGEKSSRLAMLGSAVITTVASRMIIRYVARMTPRISVGFGRAAASGSAWRARSGKRVRSKTGLSRLEELHFNRRMSPLVSEASSGYTPHYSGGSLRFVKAARRKMTSPPTEQVQLSKRPKRADALRNYEKLVAAGREAFTEADRSASLEDVARRAGVGIGTLYRHFPTRTDLVQAIYVDEVEALSRSAGELADDVDPWEALTAWLGRFVGYVATKQALADELFAVTDPERQAIFAGSRSMLYDAGEPLLRRAQDAGVVRPDVTIEEVVRLVAGIAKIPADDPADIERVMAVALDGLRYRGEERRPTPRAT